MKINNENLVMQLQLHDEKALDYLVKEYGIQLISIIRKHLFTLPHLQLECLVDTVLSIWKNIECFDERNEFENWVGSVARYRCLEFLKKHQQEATIAWLIEKEIAEEKEVMISSLKEQHRELFFRFYVGETVEKGSREYREYTYHNMYELLNEIDTDICEYEKEPLSEQEQIQVIKEVHTKTKDKKHGVSLNKYLETIFRRAERKHMFT